MSITVWHELISRYFEFYLEEKLDLLGASVVKIQQMQQAEVAAAGDGSGTSPPPLPPANLAFQLEGPLRQLPTSFIDASHEFMERLYFTLPDGYTDAAGGGDNTMAGHTDGHGGGGLDSLMLSGDASAHNPFLYGEVSSIGVRQVLKELRAPLVVYPPTINGGDDGSSSRPTYTFVDLGSGTGKMVVEAAHLLSCEGSGSSSSSSSSSRCVGIELDHGRAAVATLATQRMIAEGTAEGGGGSLNASAVSACCTLSAHTCTGGGGVAVNNKGHASSSSCVVEMVEGDFLKWLREAKGHTPIGGANSAEGRHTILFCCGVGFGDGFVREICDAIDAYRLNAAEEANKSEGTADTKKKTVLAAAVLLFRQHPKDHPLYQSAIRAGERAAEEADAFNKDADNSDSSEMAPKAKAKARRGASMTFIHTSWMDEAPAMVLRWV